MDDIEQRIKAIVAERLRMPTEKVEGSSSFINDLGADTLDIVEVILDLEDEFDLHIPEGESEVETVDDAIRIVRKRLAGH